MLGFSAVMGVYLDDQMSGWEVTNNTFRDVVQGILVGGGRHNTIEVIKKGAEPSPAPPDFIFIKERKKERKNFSHFFPWDQASHFPTTIPTTLTD